MPKKMKQPLAPYYKCSTYILYALLLIGFYASPAWAHRVMVFAWVEGDIVYTQSKFSGGKRVKYSIIVVYDMAGSKLLEGKTDENGEFSFQVPKKAALKVVLEASMGHQAEWIIPVEEIIPSAKNDKGNSSMAKSDTSVPDLSKEVSTNLDGSDQSVQNLSAQEIQALVESSLDKKLTPIIHMLTKSIDCGPGITEVLGGIGYIFGIVGLFLYFSARKKEH